MTLNFKNVLCSYRGIKKILQIPNLQLLLIFAYGQTAVKHVNTKAPRLNYFRERKVFWRKKNNQQEDAFLFYFGLPCPPQALTKFVVSSRGSTPFFLNLNLLTSSSTYKGRAGISCNFFLRDKVWGRWLAIFAAWQRTNLAMMGVRAIWDGIREENITKLAR